MVDFCLFDTPRSRRVIRRLIPAYGRFYGVIDNDLGQFRLLVNVHGNALCGNLQRKIKILFLSDKIIWHFFSASDARFSIFMLC